MMEITNVYVHMHRKKKSHKIVYRPDPEEKQIQVENQNHQIVPKTGRPTRAGTASKVTKDAQTHNAPHGTKRNKKNV